MNYNCNVTAAATISWTAAPALTDPALARFSPSGQRMLDCSDFPSVNCTRFDFLATLTNVGTIDMNGAADMTSTFRFTATAELNGTVVECSAVTAGGPEADSQDLIVQGTYVNTFIVLQFR